MPFEFDPDLASATTIPSRYYTDPQFLAAEIERVFGRTWQLAARLEQLSEKGMFLATEVAGEPVLLVRGSDEVLRAFSNVCRHRAGPVAKGSGKRPVLQCGYHGWTYSLEGNLRVTPEFEGVANFDKGSVCLPQFKVEVWGQLVFVNLDVDAEPLAAYMGDMSEKFAHRNFASYHHAASKNWELDCNWKVYVDNYLEGYHIPIVHPGLFKELDYANYRTETKRLHSIQHSPIRNAKRLKADGENPEAEYFWVFPNLMINVYADNFSTNVILPLGHGRTLTLFDWYFAEAPSEKLSKELGRVVSFSDEIQLEDIEICELVQKGLNSRTYDSGRYSVQRENGVHHFHGLLHEFLS
jgi:choline monooxygenase